MDKLLQTFLMCCFCTIAIIAFASILIVMSWTVDHYFVDILGERTQVLLKFGFLLILPVAVFTFVAPQHAQYLDRASLLGVLLVVLFSLPLAFAEAFLYLDCLNWSDAEKTQTFTIEDHYYFSYLTFATLGYGDIVPKPSCRSLAVMESVCGMISIAGIVALYAAAAAGRHASDAADSNEDTNKT